MFDELGLPLCVDLEARRGFQQPEQFEGPRSESGVGVLLSQPRLGRCRARVRFGGRADCFEGLSGQGNERFSPATPLDGARLHIDPLHRQAVGVRVALDEVVGPRDQTNAHDGVGSLVRDDPVPFADVPEPPDLVERLLRVGAGCGQGVATLLILRLRGAGQVSEVVPADKDAAGRSAIVPAGRIGGWRDLPVPGLAGRVHADGDEPVREDVELRGRFELGGAVLRQEARQLVDQGPGRLVGRGVVGGAVGVVRARQPVHDPAALVVQEEEPSGVEGVEERADESRAKALGCRTRGELRAGGFELVGCCVELVVEADQVAAHLWPAVMSGPPRALEPLAQITCDSGGVVGPGAAIAVVGGVVVRQQVREDRVDPFRGLRIRRCGRRQPTGALVVDRGVLGDVLLAWLAPQIGLGEGGQQLLELGPPSRGDEVLAVPVGTGEGLLELLLEEIDDPGRPRLLVGGLAGLGLRRLHQGAGAAGLDQLDQGAQVGGCGGVPVRRCREHLERALFDQEQCRLISRGIGEFGGVGGEPDGVWEELQDQGFADVQADAAMEEGDGPADLSLGVDGPDGAGEELQGGVAPALVGEEGGEDFAGAVSGLAVDGTELLGGGAEGGQGCGGHGCPGTSGVERAFRVVPRPGASSSALGLLSEMTLASRMVPPVRAEA